MPAAVKCFTAMLKQDPLDAKAYLFRGKSHAKMVCHLLVFFVQVSCCKKSIRGFLSSFVHCNEWSFSYLREFSIWRLKIFHSLFIWIQEVKKDFIIVVACLESRLERFLYFIYKQSLDRRGPPEALLFEWNFEKTSNEVFTTAYPSARYLSKLWSDLPTKIVFNLSHPPLPRPHPILQWLYYRCKAIAHNLHSI